MPFAPVFRFVSFSIVPSSRRAGEMLLEAKEQVKHGEWKEWVSQNFHLSHATAKIYMSLAGTQKASALAFSSLSDFVRKTSNPNYNIPHTVRPAAWDEPVQHAMDDPAWIERIRRGMQKTGARRRLRRNDQHAGRG